MTLSRKRFMEFTGLGLSAVVLAACAPKEVQTAVATMIFPTEPVVPRNTETPSTVPNATATQRIEPSPTLAPTKEAFIPAEVWGNVRTPANMVEFEARLSEFRKMLDPNEKPQEFMEQSASYQRDLDKAGIGINFRNEGYIGPPYVGVSTSRMGEPLIGNLPIAYYQDRNGGNNLVAFARTEIVDQPGLCIRQTVILPTQPWWENISANEILANVISGKPVYSILGLTEPIGNDANGFDTLIRNGVNMGVGVEQLFKDGTSTLTGPGLIRTREKK